MSFVRIKDYGSLVQRRYKHMFFFRDRNYERGDVPKKIYPEGKRDYNLIRARSMVQDILLCNEFDYFCTFTFDGGRVDRYDYLMCRKALTSFFAKYKERKSPDFKYLIVPEFHKDSAIHFHGMISGIRPEDFYIPDEIPKRFPDGSTRMVPNTKQYVRWRSYTLGHFSCSVPFNHEKCAVYVSKYITKELVGMPLGRRMFMCSTNLKRPKLVFDADDVPLYFPPTWENQHIAVAYSEKTFGAIDELWEDSCADVRNPEQEVTEAECVEPLTWEQLTLSLQSRGYNESVDTRVLAK